jgi:DNA sulfur modification protein DndD
MKFRKLTIENYKSFQFATEIIFPVGEDGRSIFLIGGMNGAGKTSIMEAINYCLYGAKPDEIFRHINRGIMALRKNRWSSQDGQSDRGGRQAIGRQAASW